MDNVIPFPTPEDDIPWFNAFAMCLGCHHRWLCVVTPLISLFTLPCPKCGLQKSFGSIAPEEYVDAVFAYSEPMEDAE